MTLKQLKNNLGLNNSSISFKDWINNLAKNYENKSELDILKSCYLSFTAFFNNLKSSRTLSSMIKKEQEYNELTLFDFDKKFMKNWEAWMLEQNLSLSTVGTYAKYLDFVLSEAIDKGAYPEDLKPIGSNKNQYEIICILFLITVPCFKLTATRKYNHNYKRRCHITVFWYVFFFCCAIKQAKQMTLIVIGNCSKPQNSKAIIF